jgi:predicted nucleic acid-binding protein
LQTKPVILDSGPLGRVINPGPHRHLDIKLWLLELRHAKVQIMLPEIVDYEIRRNLLAEGLTGSLALLDKLGGDLLFLRFGEETLKSAAGLWAQARRHGRATSHPLDLDVDVMVAALAIETGAIVATDNVAHLGRFVDARPWSAITPAALRV